MEWGEEVVAFLVNTFNEVVDAVVLQLKLHHAKLNIIIEVPRNDL
jgi:hypothetical protein